MHQLQGLEIFEDINSAKEVTTVNYNVYRTITEVPALEELKGIRKESDAVVEGSRSSPISIDRHWRQRLFRGEIDKCGNAEVLELGAVQ